MISPLDGIITNTETEEISYQEISDPAVMAVQPLVSIHMLTYNHEPYITRAIEGVLMQETNFPIELIIGEDCSTDRTREIVLNYQQKRPDIIRVVLWKKNTGGLLNFQVVNKLLRGKYVAFCEGDDYWIHPKKLQIQIEIMESNPKIGLVYGDYYSYDTATKNFIRWFPAKRQASEYKDLFTKLIVNEVKHPLTCTVCMRKDLYFSILNDNKRDFGMGFLSVDTQLWLEASRLTEFKKINEPLAVHNILSESKYNTKDIVRKIEFTKSGYELFMHYVKKYHCPKSVERIVHKRHCTLLIELAFRANDLALAEFCAQKLEAIGIKLSFKQRLILLGLKRGKIKPIIAFLLRVEIRDIIKRILLIIPWGLYQRLRKLYDLYCHSFI
ncbi:MAG: glycosyltransferase [candidate division WOR-3 bacterium]